MYERNAVILERYFAQKFYYKDKHNLKNNYENYCVLIDILEKYQEVSEAEDKIISECEDIANNIKQIQKNQGSLYRKTLKLHEDRNSIFENIDEPANELGKQLDKIEKEIDKNNEKMRPIDQEFVDTISMFNEKSDIRSECGKKRRKIEKEYRAILEKTISNISEIDTEKIAEIKDFISADNTITSKELKEVILKNGEKEKIPFDSNVVEKSIEFGQELHKQEAKLLIEVYEKTNNIIDEVSDNVVKIKRYKKLSKDTKNRLAFINVQKEYLIEFLDNERQSIGLGKQEHNKLMKEACIDFKLDTEQISNLNKLLTEEINGKATVTMYNNMYSTDYLQDLLKKESDFEKKLSELNLVGKILNPIYWRIGSIQKLYTTFNKIVEEEYGKNLSRFKYDISDYEDEFEKEETYVTANTSEEKNVQTNSGEMEYDRFMEYYDNFTSDDPVRITNEYDDNDEDEDDEEVDDGQEDMSIYQDIYEEDDEEDDDEDDFYDDNDDDVYEDIDVIIQNRKKKNARGKKEKTGKKKGLFGFRGK